MAKKRHFKRVIREYAEKDYAEVSELLKHSINELLVSKRQKKLLFDHWNHEMLSHKKHSIFVLKQHHIVGIAGIIKNTVNIMFIHPKHKESSHGLFFLNFLESLANKNNFSYLFLHTFPEYSNYFRKFGYTEGEIVHHDSSGILFVEMHKRLIHPKRHFSS